ncbi:hypothetical protein TIFTF001_027512 [Ficus carica]|uniref:Uncharacterized protein n=1 Tax=Ficus carica TaxID=3494 RepID=A0AA88DNB6_FICCA|nr:hypothetical protein TIFTF001_027512 [Ficus carica]
MNFHKSCGERESSTYQVVERGYRRLGRGVGDGLVAAREIGRGALENKWWSRGRRRLEPRENWRGAIENDGEVERERTRENGDEVEWKPRERMEEGGTTRQRRWPTVSRESLYVRMKEARERMCRE